MEHTKELQKELCSFPSYLNSCEDLGTCSKKKLKQVLDRITSDLETYDNEVERIRDLNLIALLHHELGEKETALEYINKALSSNERNINALVIKGWFLLETVDVYECKEILKRLGALRNDSTEMLHARAEVAYIYTRLGIKFYDKAIAMFESVFSEIDKDKLTVDPIAFVVWKFGLALTIKRTLNFNNLHEQNNFDLTLGKINAAIKEYSDIFESEIGSRYKARSLVEMGELVNITTKSKDNAMRLPANSNLLKKPVEKYFEEALELCDSDPFVLQRCGKHYRYKKDIDKSIELLRKSIQGKYNEYNSYGHHHLALSLKRKLESSLQTTYSKRSGPHRQPTNSRRGRRARDSRGVSNQRRFQPDANSGGLYSAAVEPAYTYSSQDQLDSGTQNFHEKLSSVPQSSTTALGHNQRKPKPGDFRLSETDPSSEFEEKLNLSARASSGHYDPRFSRQRTRARSSRGRGGGFRNVRSFISVDYGSGNSRSQSRHSGSPQRCEEMNKQTTLKQLLVKSPKRVISLEGAEEHKVAEILEHLEKAYQISGNIAALYDKGLTYRALGRYDDAMTVFKLFFEKDRSSLVYLANAYEQSAFCMITKLETLPDSEERVRKKIMFNLQHFLSACLEISYKSIMQKYPDFNYYRASQPVLEDILNKKERTKESREELGDFYRKVQSYTKAIDCAKDLLILEGDQDEQYATRMKMIGDYCNLQQYDNAIVTINLIGNQMDDLPLFLQVHLEGGLQSYMKDEFELAKIRLKTALNKSCGKLQAVSDEEEKETNFFDIFILCSETNEDSPRQVKQGLENLGLQITVNFDDLRPSETKSAGVIKVMQNSSHFICFLEQDNTPVDDAHMLYWLEVMKNVYVERGSGQILFVKRDQITDIPTYFAHFPSMEYEDDMANVAQETKMEETQLEWLKTLLQKLVNNSHRATNK